MGEAIAYDYTFVLEEGETIRFHIELERESLAMMIEPGAALPAWAELGFRRCDNCSLDEKENSHCPVARNLVSIVDKFKSLVSHEQVRVVVETEERTYQKETTVHQGLSSLLGIVMVTSGCPVLEYLKPMVRFHLPFASIEETLYRMTSMYLLAQFLRKQEGQTPGDDLSELAEIYGEVSKVNKDFSLRLAQAAERDANVNALVELDVFASMVQLVAEDALTSLKDHFSAYLK